MHLKLVREEDEEEGTRNLESLEMTTSDDRRFRRVRRYDRAAKSFRMSSVRDAIFVDSLKTAKIKCFLHFVLRIEIPIYRQGVAKSSKDVYSLK